MQKQYHNCNKAYVTKSKISYEKGNQNWNYSFDIEIHWISLKRSYKLIKQFMAHSLKTFHSHKRIIIIYSHVDTIGAIKY